MKIKTKVKYTDVPIGDIRLADDFLPPPKNLAFKEDSVKVTITLSKASVNFFKKEAKKHHTPYQKMIRKLLDLYAARYQNKSLTSQ